MSMLSVAAGGAIGAGLRHLVSRASLRVFGPDFPWGTMIVNVAGSLAMGVLAALLMHRMQGEWSRWAPFLMTGVLGGFTTFSAFSLDALTLAERGRTLAAAAYIGGSVVLAVGALALGLALGRNLAP